VCKKLIKNSQPFGKKNSENRRGDFFLTHTVYNLARFVAYKREARHVLVLSGSYSLIQEHWSMCFVCFSIFLYLEYTF